MIVLFNEPNFPTLGTSTLPLPALKKALSAAGPVVSFGLDRFSELDPQKVDLLVMPYGSAFPKAGWEKIHDYLKHGGNLLVLGGRPFEVPVLMRDKKWEAESPQTAYYQSLNIEQVNAVPAKRVVKHQGAQGQPLLSDLAFPPMEAHSLMVRLTEIDQENRCGAIGPMDSELKPLMWGLDAKGVRVSAPVVMLDRFQGPFAGGRWIFAPAQWPNWNLALEKMISRLALFAQAGSLQATLRPALACYQPGAQPQLNLWVRGHERHNRQVQLDYRITLEGEKVYSQSLRVDLQRASHYQTLSLPVTVEAGLYKIEGDVSVNGKLSHSFQQGFWGWDENLVRSSAAVGISGTRFTKNGKTISAAGTTYMAGDVSRKFLWMPNPAVWDQDMGEMAEAGLNMVRTGIWADHRQALLDSGNPREDMLCALDAYVLTCLKNDLILTFNFFSFIPDNWPNVHPYLDPRIISIQREFMLSLIRRYAHIPSLMWDFINEPSVSNPDKLWKSRPLAGKLETDAFVDYLKRTHGDLEKMRARWNLTPEELCSWDQVELPLENDFAEPWAPQSGVINGAKAYDFNRYGQELFAKWVADHLTVLKEATSQLFCVGQDEGGVASQRPNNHLFHGPLDYTCNHTWWETEDLVAGVTASRVKGKPFLAQETGIMFTDNLNRAKRRTEEEAGKLFERKLAASFMGGSGFIQWCWNINQYMSDRNEVEIGAWRADKTARPEAMVLSAFGDFLKKAQPFLQEEASEASIVVVESFSGSLSSKSHTVASQRASHRVLSALRLPFHTLAEHEFNRLTGEKIILFPSVKRMDPKYLSEWVRAAKGRVLWVSGPVAQDGWGLATEGLSSFGIREKRLEVNPEEILRLKGGEEYLNYTNHKPLSVDKDMGLAPKIHHFLQNKTSLYYAPLPVEANDQREPVAAMYREMAGAGKVKAYCEVKGSSSWEVTVLPRIYSKSAFYIAFNEGPEDRKIQIRDLKFGFKAVLNVPAGRAALAVFDSKGKTLASYTNPAF